MLTLGIAWRLWLPVQVQAADYYLGQAGADPTLDAPIQPGQVYDGSSADKVDAFLRKIPENNTIYLSSGIFETRGVWDNWGGGRQNRGFRLKSGWRLAGSGTNSLTGTVFRLVDVPLDGSGLYNFNAVLSTAGIGLYRTNHPVHLRFNVDDVTIRDLQIDCNYPELARLKGTPAFQVAGIQLLGNRGLALINVLVRNAASKKVDRFGQAFECFQVYIRNKWATNGPGDYYLDRVAVADYHGGYTSAICVNGHATGMIRNCTVDLTSDTSQRYGINFASGLTGFTIMSNAVHNATRGINNDTGPVCTAVTIASNQFSRCVTGMFLANSQHCLVLANTVALTGTGAGIVLRNHPSLADVKTSACTLQRNVIIGSGGEGISLCYQNEFDRRDLTLYWSSNNIVQDNILSPLLQNKIPPSNLAPNTVRPGNRRHDASYPTCPGGGNQANLAGLGFPSDIGPEAACAYCPAKAANTTFGHISRVRIEGTQLDLPSDAGDGSGYSDFTTGYAMGTGTNKFLRAYAVRWADVERGRSYRIQVQASNLQRPQNAAFSVYVDWDHDGTFTGDRERVTTVTGQSVLDTTLVVPRNAPPGSTRMRIMLGDGSAPGPCQFNTFSGEVEDYTLSVLP